MEGNGARLDRQHCRPRSCSEGQVSGALFASLGDDEEGLPAEEVEPLCHLRRLKAMPEMLVRMLK